MRVRNTALSTWFIVHDDRLEIATGTEREPDVIISGSLLALARMAGVSGIGAVRDGSLRTDAATRSWPPIFSGC